MSEALQVGLDRTAEADLDAAAVELALHRQRQPRLELERRPGFGSLGGLGQRQPTAIREPGDQEKLQSTSGLEPPGEQPCRDDAGIVDNEEITGVQQSRQIADVEVFDLPVGA